MGFMMSTSGVDTVTAAARRRQRRLRAYLRYARMSVAMALAESTHHSSRGQKNARTGEWGPEMNYTATVGNPLPPLHTHTPTPQPELFSLFEEESSGSRPDQLFEVRPQEAVQRDTVEQIVDSAPDVPSLDVPVPLLAEQPLDVLALLKKQEMEEETRILEGAPVSAADRQAWRRWAKGSSSSSGAKRLKINKRKKELPKMRAVGGSGGTVLPRDPGVSC